MSSLSDAAVARLRAILDQQPIDWRYVIHELIGEGGMGTVYSARDIELDREVALKVLRVDNATPHERERIIREARVLASLEHPAIVPVHDVGSLSDGRLFYVMKRVRGSRLDEFARADRSRSELLRVFLQICDAVSFAHSVGVIHRDLKPQNVMLGAFGEVLVLDWGIAKAHTLATQSTDASDSTAAGTPGYMAPEQHHAIADERSDIFGLGGILYFLLTQQHPQPSSDLTEQWPNGIAIPAALRAICDRARAIDSSARYQEVAALTTDVVNYLDALPVSAHSEGVFERVRRNAVRHRTAILLVLAYLVIRVAMLVVIRR